MDRRTADAAVYPALSLASSVYALILDDNKQHAPPDSKLEPDWTWLEVVIGTALCLVASALRTRLDERPTWRSSERATWLAFVWGGLPIIVWQVLRAVARNRREHATLQHYITRTPPDEQGPTRPPLTLAGLRRRGPEAN